MLGLPAPARDGATAQLLRLGVGEIEFLYAFALDVVDGSIVIGGGPTVDKPTVTLEPPRDPERVRLPVSAAMKLPGWGRAASEG